MFSGVVLDAAGPERQEGAAQGGEASGEGSGLRLGGQLPQDLGRPSGQ